MCYSLYLAFLVIVSYQWLPCTSQASKNIVPYHPYSFYYKSNTPEPSYYAKGTEHHHLQRVDKYQSHQPSSSDHRDSLSPLKLVNGKPNCASDYEYCLYNHEYPLDRVHVILNRHYGEAHLLYDHLRGMKPQDWSSWENKSISFQHDPRGRFVCSADIRHLRPGWAKSTRGLWLAVVNTDSFQQTIRIERCKYPNHACEYLPPCYASSCKQRYALTQLLSVNPVRPDLKPVIETFSFPSGCSCFVQDYQTHS